MKLLIKIPTRNRPEQFLSILLKHIDFLDSKEDVSFLLTLDSDDDSMNNLEIRNALNSIESDSGIPILYLYGISLNKIHAVNRDLEDFQDWDILILSSDDMLPNKQGYDLIIKNDMKKYFPNLDGGLYYPDGFTPLNTMPIMGKRYYDRFGYIYNPNYISFFCDNEFHEVAGLLNKQYYSKEILFKHLHPCNTKDAKWDILYEQNNSSWNYDQQVYIDRRKKMFEVTYDKI